MTKLLLTGAVLLLHFLVFLSLGTLFLKLFKRERFSISLAVLLGYFCYFGLFEVLCLPFVFLQTFLTAFSWVLLAVLGASVAAACVTGVRSWAGQVKTIPGIPKDHSVLFLFLLAAVAFQCFFVAVYYDGSADAAYYVGVASTSAYTDTLGTYNPYTGNLMKSFNVRYVFSCYPLHNAFVAKMTGLPAIVQAKTVMAVVNAVIANLLYYQIGCRLFQGKSRKYPDLMVLFLTVMNIYSNSIYLPASFFFLRLYEGKAVLANIIFPMILYCSIRIWQDEQDRLAWAALFFCNLTAVTFSGSSFLVIFGCGAVILPVILFRHRFRLLKNWIVGIAPIFVWAAAYLLVKLQVLSLSIRQG